MAKHSKTAKDEALAQMRKWLKPGDTVHTILDHVSSSGMSRDIRVVIVRKDGTILDGRGKPDWAPRRIVWCRTLKFCKASCEANAIARVLP